MRLSKLLLRAVLLAPCAALVLPAVIHGQTPTTATPAPPRPITDHNVTAVDVIATPAGDLNLRKGKIPALLDAAVADPYNLAGLRTCVQLSVAINQLDAILGPDRDIPADRAEKLSVGRVAQSAVGSSARLAGPMLTNARSTTRLRPAPRGARSSRAMAKRAAALTRHAK
jgi:hypothetical protein